MTALDKLIEAVEEGAMTAACVATVYEQTHFTDVRGDFWKAAQIHAAYHGSLDAALALHEALLPGWDWGRAPGVGRAFWVRGTGGFIWSNDYMIPARAWLLAILRAYRSVQA